MYFFKGENERALADLNEAIRLDPDDLIAIYTRGELGYSMGDLDASIRDLSEVLRRDPKDVGALEKRAYAFEKKGAHELASQDRHQARLFGR